MSEAATAYQLAKQLCGILADTRPDLSPMAERLARELGRCAHGPDFASVQWYGTPYTFTSSQARVVGILWAAWKNGTPEVRQETLLESIGSALNRLSKLFGDNPAWGSMIVAGKLKGTYRLQSPMQLGSQNAHPETSNPQ